MNLENKVSIITVVFNAELSIEKTLNSIFSQTYTNFELIIIDGGSTDNSLSIINKYKSRISIIVSEPDLGIYDAMNKGINYVKGNWIYFLNAGDTLFSSNTLNEIFSKSYSKFILYGDTFLLTDSISISYPKKINKSWFFSNTICHQSVFFNRIIFESVGKFDISYNILADRDILVRSLIMNFGFEYINTIVCVYDQEGFSSKNIKKYKREELLFRFSYYSFIDFLRALKNKYFIL